MGSRDIVDDLLAALERQRGEIEFLRGRLRFGGEDASWRIGTLAEAQHALSRFVPLGM